jgi:hypothetical protein
MAQVVTASKERVQGVATTASGLRLLMLFGGLMLLGYVALTLLLLSVSTGYPSLLPQQLPALFGPLRDLLPKGWLEADRVSWLGLLNSVLYLLIIAWLFGVYLLTVRRA